MTMLPAEEITLRDGSKFKYTNFLKAEPGGIKVEYADGIKKIPFEKLTDADREKYSLTDEAFKK